jgi:hypothetical protein
MSDDPRVPTYSVYQSYGLECKNTRVATSQGDLYHLFMTLHSWKLGEPCASATLRNGQNGRQFAC